MEEQYAHRCSFVICAPPHGRPPLRWTLYRERPVVSLAHSGDVPLYPGFDMAVQPLHGGWNDREIYNIWSPDFTGNWSGGGDRF